MSDTILGQKLWHVPSQHRASPEKNQYVTVTRVGRKWAYFNLYGNEYRFDLAKQWRGGFPVDGGRYSSTATVYLDKESYEAQAECERLFTEFQLKLGYSPQPNVSASDVLDAAKMLGIELDRRTVATRT